MAKTIVQICVNPETHKCIYLTDFKDDILHYRVSTDIKVECSNVVEYEDDNVVAGPYFFHKSFLDKLIQGNQE